MTAIVTPEGIVEAGVDFHGNQPTNADAVVEPGVTFDGNSPVPTPDVPLIAEIG
jgi:hypothetical protein